MCKFTQRASTTPNSSQSTQSIQKFSVMCCLQTLQPQLARGPAVQICFTTPAWSSVAGDGMLHFCLHAVGSSAKLTLRKQLHTRPHCVTPRGCVLRSSLRKLAASARPSICQRVCSQSSVRCHNQQHGARHVARQAPAPANWHVKALVHAGT